MLEHCIIIIIDTPKNTRNINYVSIIKNRNDMLLRLSSVSCILHTKLINWNLTLYLLPKLSIQTWILAVLTVKHYITTNGSYFIKKGPIINTQIPPRKKKWWETWFTFRCPPDFCCLNCFSSPTSLWAQLPTTQNPTTSTNNQLLLFVLVTVESLEVVPNKVLASNSFHFP